MPWSCLEQMFPKCPGVEVTGWLFGEVLRCLGGGHGGRPLGVWRHSPERTVGLSLLLSPSHTGHLVSHSLHCVTPTTASRTSTRRPKRTGLVGIHWNLHSSLLMGILPSSATLTQNLITSGSGKHQPRRGHPSPHWHLSETIDKLLFSALVYLKTKKSLRHLLTSCYRVPLAAISTGKVSYVQRLYASMI